MAGEGGPQKEEAGLAGKQTEERKLCRDFTVGSAKGTVRVRQPRPVGGWASVTKVCGLWDVLGPEVKRERETWPV